MKLIDSQTKLTNKLCVSVSLDDIKIAERAAVNYDFLEYRLSSTDYKPEVLEYFFSLQNSKISCLSMQTDPEIIHKLAFYSIKYGADIIDVNLLADRDIIREIKLMTERANKSLLLSYHDFEKTPDKFKLLEIYEQCSEFDSRFIKIVCAAQNPDEVHEILSLYEINGAGNKLIAFAMGDSVKRTRIDCLLKGAPLSYVYPDFATATAPGQYSYSQALQEIKERINGA